VALSRKYQKQRKRGASDGPLSRKKHRKERDMVDEEWRERSFAPSLPPIHSRLHTQRAQRNTPVGNHTGTHASRRTLPQPRGRQITQAQFTRMLGKFNIYSSNSPTPKGVWKICLRGTHSCQSVEEPFGSS
jgi:hypothetical protein